jgi:hypothetical protein
MQIAINTYYKFEFTKEFSVLDGIYFTERALSYQDLINEGIDLFEGLYAIVGKSKPTYESHLTRYIDSIFYKLINVDTNKFVWIPDNIIIGYPNPNVNEYSKVLLTTNLGIFDDPDTLLAVKNIVAQTIKSLIGSDNVSYLEAGVVAPDTITIDDEIYSKSGICADRFMWLTDDTSSDIKKIYYSIESEKWIVLNTTTSTIITTINNQDKNPPKTGWSGGIVLEYTTNDDIKINDVKFYKSIENTDIPIEDQEEGIVKNPVFLSENDPTGLSFTNKIFLKFIESPEDDTETEYVWTIGFNLRNLKIKASHLNPPTDTEDTDVLVYDINNYEFEFDRDTLSFINQDDTSYIYSVKHDGSVWGLYLNDDTSPILTSDNKLGPYTSDDTSSEETITFEDISSTEDVVYWTKSVDKTNPVGEYTPVNALGTEVDNLYIYKINSLEQIEPLTAVSVYGTKWMTTTDYREYASRRANSQKKWIDTSIDDYYTKYKNIQKELISAYNKIEALESLS